LEIEGLARRVACGIVHSLSRFNKIEIREGRTFSSYKDGRYNSDGIRRRTFLIGAGTAAIGFTWVFFEKHAPVHAKAPPVALPKTVRIVEFTDSGQRTETATLTRVVKTEDEWRNQLSPDSFEITRRAGTERPYTNENPNAHAKGVFRCICCDTALFDSSTKFESGTVWPSFWSPIAKENV
jgi:peptide-methionine (R)-S-oxide reductase